MDAHRGGDENGPDVLCATQCSKVAVRPGGGIARIKLLQRCVSGLNLALKNFFTGTRNPERQIISLANATKTQQKGHFFRCNCFRYNRFGSRSTRDRIYCGNYHVPDTCT